MPCNFRSCRVVGSQATADDYNISLYGVMEESDPLTNLDTTEIRCVDAL